MNLNLATMRVVGFTRLGLAEAAGDAAGELITSARPVCGSTRPGTHQVQILAANPRPQGMGLSHIQLSKGDYDGTRFSVYD